MDISSTSNPALNAKLTMYEAKLTHIQQRIATIVAYSQRRGITTWVIAGVIGVLFENYIMKASAMGFPEARVIAETGIFVFNFLFLVISIPMFLYSLFRKGDPRKVIIPPSRLTGHFTLNFASMFISAIISLCALYLITFKSNLSLPTITWLNFVFHGYLSLYAFRNEIKLSQGEILPGLHNYALKELTKVSVFPSLLRGKMLIFLVFVVSIVLSVPTISVIMGSMEGHWPSFVDLMQTKVFWPVLGIISLTIFMIMRESEYREIKSLMVLEKLLLKFPDLSDTEFGFLIHATKWDTPFLSYAQFLIRFNLRQFNRVTAALQHASALRNSSLGPDEQSYDFFEAAGNFRTVLQNYFDHSSALILWLTKTIPNVIGEEWQSLLDLERQVQSTLGEYAKAFSND